MLQSICQQIWKTQQWPRDWKRSVFIPIPKKGSAKECSNYCTIALISHSSKVMLKILQARLQQYVNRDLPDVQAGFRKGRGTRDQIANICWIIKKAWEKHLREHSYVSETSEVSQNNHSFSTPAETLSPLSMNVNTKFVWDSTFDSTLWLWQTACFTKLGKKVMTNLDSILKSRDIPLSTKVYRVKTMFFSSSHVWMLLSRPVLSNNLWSHGLQHTRLSCLSPSPEPC